MLMGTENTKLKIGDFVGFIHRPTKVEFPDARWHLVYITPKHSGEARKRLDREEIPAYSPMVREMKPIPLRKITESQRGNAGVFKQPVVKQLFVGYYFLKMDLAKTPWRDIFRAAFIHGMLCVGDQPYPMPEHYVEGLMEREVDGAIPGTTMLQELLPQIVYDPGEEVRVVDGAFAQHNATVEEVDDRGRITLLVTCFRRATRYMVTPEMIEKL